MALARLECANCRNGEIGIGYSERAAGLDALRSSWRAEALAIHAASNNGSAPAIDARRGERICNAAGDRDHAIDRAIEQVRRENAVGQEVHPPRNDQRT